MIHNCDEYIKLYSMKEIQSLYSCTKLIQERTNLRFHEETLECQMIQVLRQIENK